MIFTDHETTSSDADVNDSARGTFRPDDPVTCAEVTKIIALVKETMQ